MKVEVKLLWQSGAALDALASGKPKDFKLFHKIARIYQSAQEEIKSYRQAYGVFHQNISEGKPIMAFSKEAEILENQWEDYLKDQYIDIVSAWEDCRISLSEIKLEEFPDLTPALLGSLDKWLLKE